MSEGFQAARIQRTAPPTFDTAAAVRAMALYGALRHPSIITLGALSAGDAGGGHWRWDPDSIEADNTGTVLALDALGGAAGRYVRVHDGSVNLAAFGLQLGGSDDSSACVAAFAALGGEFGELIWPNASVLCRQALAVRNNSIVRGSGPGSKLYFDADAVPCDLMGTGTDNAMIYNEHYARLSDANVDTFSFSDMSIETYGSDGITHTLTGVFGNVKNVTFERMHFICTDGSGKGVTSLWFQACWRNIAVRDCYFSAKTQGDRGGSVWASSINGASLDIADVSSGFVVENCTFERDQGDESVAFFSRQGLMTNVTVRNCLIRSETTGGIKQNVSTSMIPSCDVDPAEWTASATVSVDAIRKPTQWNRRYYRCTTAGTTGASEPVWPISPLDTVTDGTAVWTCIACGLIGATFENNYLYGSNIGVVLIKLGQYNNLAGTAREDYTALDDILVQNNTVILRSDETSSSGNPISVLVYSSSNVRIVGNTFLSETGAYGEPRAFINSQSSDPIDLIAENRFIGKPGNFISNAKSVQNNTFTYTGTDTKSVLYGVEQIINNMFTAKAADFVPSAWIGFGFKVCEKNRFWEPDGAEWIDQEDLFYSGGFRHILMRPDSYVNLISHGRTIMDATDSNGRWTADLGVLTVTEEHASFLDPGGKSECSRYQASAETTAVYQDSSVFTSNEKVTLWFAARSLNDPGRIMSCRLGLNAGNRSRLHYLHIPYEWRMFIIQYEFGAAAGGMHFELGFPSGCDIQMTPFMAALSDEPMGLCATDLGASGGGSVHKPYGAQWISPSIPTWGAWRKGDRVHSTNLGSGLPQGWVCWQAPDSFIEMG